MPRFHLAFAMVPPRHAASLHGNDPAKNKGSRVRIFRELSTAEKRLVVTYASITLAGGVLSLVAFDTLAAQVGKSQETRAVWLAFAGAVGGLIGARSAASFFGRSGPAGTLLIFAGVLFLTVVFGIAAGSLILPIYGTMFGPWLAVVGLVSHPVAAVLWITSLTAFHFARSAYAVERDTVFDWAPPEETPPI